MLELHDDYDQDNDSKQPDDGSEPPKWDEYEDVYIEEHKREMPALPPPNITDALIDEIYRRQKQPDSGYSLN